MFEQPFYTQAGPFVSILNFADDISRLFRYENQSRVLASINSSANLYNEEGGLIGRFRMDDEQYWVFESEDGTVVLAFGNKDLLKTEVKTYRYLIENKLLGFDF